MHVQSGIIKVLVRHLVSGIVFDMAVNGSTVHFNPGFSYHPGPLTKGSYTIKEMEVFQVSGLPPVVRITASTRKQYHDRAMKSEPVTRFTADVNEAINAKQACLLQAEAEMFRSEESFDEEQTFIEKFASGDEKDVIVLNILGTTSMVTTRSTLCVADDCMLAKQFDNFKWTEHYSSTLIRFNPYCFGKILDHLRLNRLHSLGLIANKPTLPKVRDSQKKSFEKCVDFYFPGNASKSIMG